MAATDRVVFDLLHPDLGEHELLLATPSAAVQVLASFLVPDHPPSPRVLALAGRRTPQEVAAVLPERGRTATTVLTQTQVAGAGARALTLVEHPAGTAVCWATPDGSVQVQPLDEAAAVELARQLLQAQDVMAS
jgi:hypothetical protein